MKAKTFENLIRKVVREEIDYALRREIKSLKEDLRDDLKPTIIENTHKMVEVPKPVGGSLKEKIMGKKPIKNKNFTSNSTLNDLLNETAQGDTNLDNNRSPISMEEDFSTIGGVPAEAAPQAVVEAVTRDYSGLMKAIDKRNNK
jgi:hypothetical protein